ncbi:hypothetical protein Pmani_038762 [Petrolisthes manimaculis]|uniref:Ragulator complex protein LAMTOR1 n=2 Tax=Petrolisthes manimaculis TaxID=1843537 RepID=A0AAE1TK77_9EUCA|nr:hypothetical protein Pmani_038762 [Petrolisthes manimaculis]
MGCCCSSEEESVTQDGDVSERTRLLNDPVSNVYQVNSSNTDYTTTSTNKYKSDEQSALNRILQQTASNIIDVGALECHTLEQHEYIERVRMYNQRLNTLYTQKVVNKKALPDVNKLLVDLPSTERTLSAQPISLTDYSMSGKTCVGVSPTVNK